MRMHMLTEPLTLLAGRATPAARPIVLPRATGVLTVVHGRVWVTQCGEGGDRVLDVGDRLRLVAARGVVIEPLQRGQPASIDWQPEVRLAGRVVGAVGAVGRAAMAGALAGLSALAGTVASGLRRTEQLCSALSRHAAVGAQRAQQSR